MSIVFAYSRSFVRDFKQLRKRHRRIQDDWDSLLAEINDAGYRGQSVPGFGGAVFKVRLTNRSTRRGKSGGFRAIYEVVTPSQFRFMHIYSKSDKDEISDREVSRMLGE